MEISMLALAQMTLRAFFLGIAFGALYDIFRITRVAAGVRYKGIALEKAEKLYLKEFPLIGSIKRRENAVGKKILNLYIALGDIVYCSLIGAALCIFFYYTNDGIIRWQGVAAIALGFFLYHITVGAVVISFAEIIYIFLKIIIKFLLFAIAFPFRIMYNIFIRGIKVIYGVTLKRILVKIHRRSSQLEMKRLLLEADSGFLQNFLKG